VSSDPAAQDRYRQAFAAAVEAHRAAGAALNDGLMTAGQLLQRVLAEGGKVLVCGNGGSAAQSQHFAAELTGRYQRDRAALAAMALSVDSSALTAIGNDYGFDRVFARQVEALGQRGDLLVAISTSGQSPNVIEAARAARVRGIAVIALTGASAGTLGESADVILAVPDAVAARVQEVHLTVLHVLCDEIERAMVGDLP